MIAFVAANLSTILISALLFLVVALIIRSMIKKRKSGKSGCGCGCDGCPSSSLCHKQ